MSVVLVERIPLPRLSTYVVLSVLLLLAAIIHVYQNDSVSSNWGEDNLFHNSTSAVSGIKVVQPITPSSGQNLNTDAIVNSTTASILTFPQSIGDFIDRFCQETWCLWSIINMSYCLLILAGKAIQNIVFGELRLPEHQHVREKFWNFIFYKFIFIFGVLNVQTLEEVLLWVGWFSVLGFLHLLTALTKARFEFLTFSPAASVNQHAKLLFLLCVVLLSCCILTTLCFLFPMDFFGHVMCFMLAEIFLLFFVTSHVLFHYAIHLYVKHHNSDSTIFDAVVDGELSGTTTSNTIKNRLNPTIVIYYIDLILDTASLSIDLAHHLHMLVWSNIFLSMASLVVLIQLRYLYYELIKRIQRHRKYCKLVQLMASEFPIIEISKETCAICWESVSWCRQLPCNHIFHDTCLRQWLEQDLSCPTCRGVLLAVLQQQQQSDRPATVGSAQNTGSLDNPQASTASQGLQINGNDSGPTHLSSPSNTGSHSQAVMETAGEENVEETTHATRSHFFRFGGFRLFSWLPSFHIEISHMTTSSGAVSSEDVTSRQGLQVAAEHVQSMFPHLPQEVIIEDLQRTGCAEATVDNILEGHLTLHAPQLPTGPMQMQLDALHSTEHSEPPQHQPLHHPGLSKDVSLTSVSKNAINLSGHDMVGYSGDISKEDSGTCHELQQGTRFSKSSSEREDLLAQRKQRLLSTARRRFVSSPGQDPAQHQTSSTSTAETVS